MSYKKVTEDLGHTYDFINNKHIKKENNEFFEKIKRKSPWECLKGDQNTEQPNLAPIAYTGKVDKDYRPHLDK